MGHKTRNALRSLVVGAGVAVAALGVVPSVSADSGHYIYVTGGKAKFDGSWITVCDTAVDGNRVRAHLYRNDGQVFYTGWAPSQSCTTEGHPTSILRFRVCAENNGCSAWHDRY
ncbi:MAG: hypothetical protein AVDCRST_MAG41-1404 [uncultured Corynebacteriales bacterium]|uniref:Uncharacterized protein n=1 Tax=uncultured Mycobacteriales bacterium TaxID=581187 RepID=A0A6J4I403_9ACTN|nr:MAG: hypothetical protein AVDCRST_MAG41-1404 [uncultured Corynebacteriales bacterium]